MKAFPKFVCNSFIRVREATKKNIVLLADRCECDANLPFVDLNHLVPPREGSLLVGLERIPYF